MTIFIMSLEHIQVVHFNMEIEKIINNIKQLKSDNIIKIRQFFHSKNLRIKYFYFCLVRKLFSIYEYGLRVQKLPNTAMCYFITSTLYLTIRYRITILVYLIPYIRAHVLKTTYRCTVFNT